MNTPDLSDTMVLNVAHNVALNVQHALQEDIGTGDITAALIPEQQQATAHLICRETAVICGRPWFDEVFRQIDSGLDLNWHIEEGDTVEPNQRIVTLKGSARSILTGERTALNFLQTLSGTATRCAYYSSLVDGTKAKLLDTRKTIPGLRLAQKYAVRKGGCSNHRMGLFDAYLIKENHIAACGGIETAIKTAKRNTPGKLVEVEVENLDEFAQARSAGADRIMLDNFSLELLREAVQQNQSLPGNVPELEASGNVTEETLPLIAATGIDYISIGALTKHCQAVDLSLRLIE